MLSTDRTRGDIGGWYRPTRFSSSAVIRLGAKPRMRLAQERTMRSSRAPTGDNAQPNPLWDSAIDAAASGRLERRYSHRTTYPRK
jgi:hypothetical protein